MSHLKERHVVDDVTQCDVVNVTSQSDVTMLTRIITNPRSPLLATSDIYLREMGLCPKEKT